MTPPADSLQRRRELRLRIARVRRRIDGRVRQLRRDGGRLIAWREYLQQSPGLAILAAFRFGRILAARTKGGRRVVAAAGRTLARQAYRTARWFLTRLWRWYRHASRSRPQAAPAQAGGDA